MFNSIKKGLSGLWNSAKSIGLGGLFQTAKNWSTGFYSAPGNYRYCGPGNSLDNGDPTNASDAACRQHDIDYDNFAKNRQKLNTNELKDLVRESDQRLISNLQQAPDRDIGSYASEYGIKLKNLLEDVGILSHEQFVT